MANVPIRKINPKDLLQSPPWVDMVKQSMQGIVATLQSSEDATKIAQILDEKLMKRLAEHVRRKVAPEKQKHVVWDFVSDNIPAMAAIITLAGHSIGDHLQHMDANDSLLSKNVKERFLCYADNVSDQRGAYMFFDNVRKCFVRTGKAINIGKRLQEHTKKAGEKKDGDSRFYRAYPTQEAHKIRITSPYFMGF